MISGKAANKKKQVKNNNYACIQKKIVFWTLKKRFMPKDKRYGSSDHLYGNFVAAEAILKNLAQCAHIIGERE